MSTASITLTAEDKTRAAFDSVRNNLSGLNQKALLAAGTLAGLGGAATIGGMVALARAVADGMDAFNDLADATGASIENISGLDNVARRTGANFDTVASSLVKFNSVLTATRKEGGEAAEIFKVIGLNAKQLREIDPAEAMRLTAVALSQFADDGNKARAVQELFGKSIREAAPFLKDLAESGALQATVTKQQAEEAERFNKQLSLMTSRATDLKREIVSGLLPAMNAVLGAMNKGGLRSGLDELGNQLFDWEGNAKRKAIQWAEDNSRDLARRARGSSNEFIRAQLEAEARDEKRRADSLRSAYYGITNVQGGRGSVNPELVDLRKSTGQIGDPAAIKAQQDAYDGLMRSVKERIAQAALERQSGRALTEEEKFSTRVIQQMTDGKVKLTTTMQANIRAELARSAALATANKQHERKVMLMQAEAAFIMENEADWMAATVADSQSRERVALAISEQEQALRDSNELLTAEAQLMGATEAQRQVTLENLRIEQQLRRQLADLDRNLAFDEGQRAIERTRLQNLAAEAKAQASQVAAMREQLGLWDSIERTAHDVFVNIFEDGAGTFKRLGQTLKASLLDLLYQMTVKRWVISIGASMGMAGVATAGQAGTAGSGLGLLGNVGSIGSLFGVGGISGSLAAGAGWLTGATTLGGSLSAAGSLMATGTSAGMFSGLGMAAGALGPIAIGLALLSSLAKGGETRSGGQYNFGNLIAAPSGGELTEGGQAAALTAQSINALLTSLGSSSRLTNFMTGLESSKNGKGFAYAGGTLSTGQAFGQGWGAAFAQDGWNNRRGSMTPEQAIAAFSDELKQATLQALAAATDIPLAVAELVRGHDFDAMATQELDAALNQVNELVTSVDQLRGALAQLPFENLRTLSFDAAAAMAKAAGGFQQLLAGANDFYANFLSPDEQRRAVASNIRNTLAAAGADFSVDQILGSSRAQFRQLTDYYGTRTDEPGMKLYATLLTVSGAFASIHPEAATLAEVLDDGSASMANYADSLRDQMDVLEAGMQDMRQYADSLRRFRGELTMGALAMLTPEQRYNAARGEFQRLAALPTTNPERLQGLEEAGRAFLQASSTYNASSMAYFADLAAVRGAVEASETAALSQVQISQMQLNVLTQQLQALQGIQANTSPGATAPAPAGGSAWGGSATTSGGAAWGGSATQVSSASWANLLMGIDWSDGAAGTAALAGLMQSYGKGVADVQSVYNWYSTQQLADHLKTYGYGSLVPGYADGGMAHGLAWVGERGPELAYFPQPTRIYSAPESQRIAGGADVASEVRALREEFNAQLKATRDELAIHRAIAATHARDDREATLRVVGELSETRRATRDVSPQVRRALPV